MMIENVIVPLDGSYGTEAILSHGVGFAKAFGSRMILLSSKKDQWIEGMLLNSFGARRQRESNLFALSKKLNSLGVETEIHCVEERTYEALDNLLRVLNQPLVINGKLGVNPQIQFDYLMPKILDRYRASIAVIHSLYTSGPAIRPNRYQRILVLLDGGSRSENILPAVKELAREHGSRLILAHIVKTGSLESVGALWGVEGFQQETVEDEMAQGRAYLQHIYEKLDYPSETRVFPSHHIPRGIKALADAEDSDLIVTSSCLYDDMFFGGEANLAVFLAKRLNRNIWAIPTEIDFNRFEDRRYSALSPSTQHSGR